MSTYNQLIARLQQDAATRKQASTVPSVPEKDPADTGTVSIPKDPAAAPAKAMTPASQTNTENTPVLNPTPPGKTVVGQETGDLLSKAAKIANSITNFRQSFSKDAGKAKGDAVSTTTPNTAHPAKTTPVTPNMPANTQVNTPTAKTAAPETVAAPKDPAGTNMIRRRIREDGFARRILPPEAKTNADLDRVLEHDRPVIIGEMEPSQKGAKSIPFGSSADSSTYYGNKFLNVFNPITTPEFVKDVNELRTYRMPLRQVITDNALKDIQTEEDGKFIATVDTIVGSTSGVGAAGVQQNFLVPGGITRDNYVTALSFLEDQLVNNGVFLMNRKTAKQFLRWDRTEVGGDLSQDLFKEGLSALTEATIFGVKHIFANGRHLL